MVVCSYCGRQLSNESSLRRHEKIHYGREQHECLKCHEIFARRDNLRRHSEKCSRSSADQLALNMDGNIHLPADTQPYQSGSSSTAEETRSNSSQMYNHHWPVVGSELVTSDAAQDGSIDLTTSLAGSAELVMGVMSSSTALKPDSLGRVDIVNFDVSLGEVSFSIAVKLVQ